MSQKMTDKTTPLLLTGDAVPPDLIKQIGNTTYDIYVHFSETSRETFTDKVVRLIQNDGDCVAEKK